MEDNKADIFLMREALESAQIEADLHIVNDGDKAIEFLKRAEADETAPRPAIILLDLNLPRKSGLEVLQFLRQTKTCAKAPVVVVTSSDSENDRMETARLGASGYFRKPSSYDAFIRIGEIIRDMLTGPPAQA